MYLIAFKVPNLCSSSWYLSLSSLRLRAPEIYNKLLSAIRVAYRTSALVSRYLRTWILACWPRCCGCGLRMRMGIPLTLLIPWIGPCAMATRWVHCWCGVVIEPENYIFQAIFTPSLMADVSGNSKNNNNHTQLFVVSNEIIYRCLLCSVATGSCPST